MTAAINAQVGRTTNWWTFGADGERSGWERSEQRFNRLDVPRFRHLWSIKLGTGLTSPIVLGNIIGSRGFKELVFVQDTSDRLMAIDADLARRYWTSAPTVAKACEQYTPAVPSLPPPIVFRFAPRSSASRTPAASGSNPAFPQPLPARPLPPPPTYSVSPMYALDAAGHLRQVNQDDGSEWRPPVEMLPAGWRAHSLNMSGSTVVASAESCNGQESGIFALDLRAPAPLKAASYKSTGAPVQVQGGAAMGPDGQIYARTAESIIVLNPETMEVRGTARLSPADQRPDGAMNRTPGLLFRSRGQTFVVSTGDDGKLHLFDTAHLDHQTAESPVLMAKPKKYATDGIWQRLSSWENADGTRYILASVWGPLNEEIGEARHGAVVAFRMVLKGDVLSFEKAWVSADLESPDPPVIAEGFVFTVANGRYKRRYTADKGWSVQASKRSVATVYALNGVTGETVWSSHDAVSAPGNLAGMIVANSRLYFSTVDGTLHAFGKFLETE